MTVRGSCGEVVGEPRAVRAVLSPDFESPRTGQQVGLAHLMRFNATGHDEGGVARRAKQQCPNYRLRLSKKTTAGIPGQ